MTRPCEARGRDGSTAASARNSTGVQPQSDNISTYIHRAARDVFRSERSGGRPQGSCPTDGHWTLRSLLAPKLPRDESFEDLMGLLVQHFDPKPLVIAERFRFYQ